MIMALKGASINEVKFPRMFAVIKPLKKLSPFVRHKCKTINAMLQPEQIYFRACYCIGTLMVVFQMMSSK
jgi:hypothetical protein